MTDGHDENATEGRAAVRLHFVQRLHDAGLTRSKGMTEAGYAEMMKQLVDFLSYMQVENLKTLAETVLDNAGGVKATQCPPEVLIRQWAKSLQDRPRSESRIFSSWLASIEGPPAQMAGHHVELMRHLRQNPRPPGPYDKIRIVEEARENRRMLKLIEERRSIGADTPDDQRFADAYAADLREANDIIQAGAERRAAKEGTAA